MAHRKKTTTGASERLELLRPLFPDIERHLLNRPSGIGKDDLIDAAVGMWTALIKNLQGCSTSGVRTRARLKRLGSDDLVLRPDCSAFGVRGFLSLQVRDKRIVPRWTSSWLPSRM